MRTTAHAPRALGFAAAVLALGFLQCNPEMVPPYQPVVTNAPDYFDYQVSVEGVTTAERFTWETTGSVAKVNLISQVMSGAAIVTISDADGTVLFTHALDASGVVGTGGGTSGAWKIDVVLTNTRGILHFDVTPQ